MARILIAKVLERTAAGRLRTDRVVGWDDAPTAVVKAHTSLAITR